MVQWSINRNKFNDNNNDMYEVVMIGGQAGPSVYVPLGNLNTASDAFGRMRVSEPFTLFDSSFRYSDNSRKWNTRVVDGASATFNANQGLMDLTVSGTAGGEIIRETTIPFGYQPGKSLLILNTFTMSPAKTGLRQRVGYFGKNNGIYLELDDNTLYLVKRSKVSGTVVNTRVAQEDWNIDPLLGSGMSLETLDITKSQIFWVDLEWLGAGSVRCGFVINGQFLVTHIFHHANEITGTYITTASLPCRLEITDKTATNVSSTLKQICTTVMSEAGYNVANITRGAANALTGKTLPSANTPMISIRLRSGRTDAVAFPVSIDFYGLQAVAYKYSIFQKVTSLTNASWVLTDSASSIEYDISATAVTGGIKIMEGIFKGQSTVNQLLLSNIFDHGLGLTRGIIDSDSAGDIITIAVSPTTNNDLATLAMTWQEHTV